MKWILGTVAAVLIAFGIYHWQNQGRERQSFGTASLSDYVPADTIYYLGAQSTESLTQFMADYYFGGTPGGQAKLLHLASKLTEEADTPPKAFAAFLIDKFQKQQDGSLASITRFFGLASSGQTALYSHGVMPVLKLPLKHPEQLNALIDEATQASGLTHRTIDIGGKSVRLWDLDNGKNEQLSIALLVDTNYATVTLLRNSDSQALHKERLGLSKPARSLADSKELLELEEKYNYSGDYSGFIHFERIAAALITPEDSLFGRELNSLMPQNKISDTLTPECAADYLTLAHAVPRLVLGYEKMAIANNVLDIESSITLEITNDKVNGELAKMRGHISQHAQRADDKILSFAYGIDLDQITPALTALWTDFTQQPFKCQMLLDLQQQAKQSNPMMLGMVFGMAQGIKGVAMSIYDLEFAQGPIPSSVSALISIAAENPSAVAALTAMAPLPALANLDIPADGTAVAIELPLLPPGLELKAAVKGKHLVIYAGEQAAQAAQSLASESLAANGLFGASVNYKNIAKLITKIDFAQMPGLGGSVDSCIAQMDFLDSMSSVSGSFYLHTDHSKDGWTMRVTGAMDKPESSTHKINGQYTTEYMDDYCQWQPMGNEQFNMDGNGQLSERDADDKCDIYIEEFQWSQLGGRLDITTQKQIERDSCSEAPVTTTPANIEICFISQASADQFVCHYNPDTDESAVLRYSRVN